MKKVIMLDSKGNTTEMKLDNKAIELALLIIDSAEGVSQQDYDSIEQEITGNWFDLIELTALNAEYRDRLINLGENV